MEFSILGPLEVREGGQDIHLGGRKLRVLLAALLVRANETVPTHQLIDDLWDYDPPPSAENALQVYISRLRKSLAAQRADNGNGDNLCSRPGGYALLVEPAELDAARFETLFAEGRRASRDGAFEIARTKFDAALALWRGPALADVSYERFVQPLVARLEELRFQALEGRIEADLALGRHADVVAELEALVSEVPTRERLVGHLMVALYRSGRQEEALAAYRRFRDIAVRDLGIEPTAELEALYGLVLRHDRVLDEPQVNAARLHPNNLPYVATTFIGRDYEKAELRSLLHEHRLITLTGAGGLGKTRLALEIAADLLDQFPDGVWMAALDAISDDHLVPQVLARAVGIRPEAEKPLEDAIVDHFAHSKALIVLDNCEHVLDRARRLAARLIDGCPNIRILATSRQPLALPVETTWPVPPMLAPDPKRGPAEHLMQYDAFRLFSERAVASAPHLANLSEDDALRVAAICRGLEGIPHALELAAAQLRSLRLKEIVEGLEDRLGFFSLDGATPRRHQTLRATIDWSYDLLDEPERIAFSHVSIFAGSFTLEAATAICDDIVGQGHDIEGMLSRLSQKSLIVAEQTATGQRWRMLETLRSYGRERLRVSGELEDVARRYGMFFADLVERAEPELRGSDQKTWMREIEEDLDNIRAALGWALDENNADGALRLAGSLWWFWATSPDEGQHWLEAALALDPPAPSTARARTLLGAGMIAWFQARHDDANALNLDALATSRVVGDRLTEGFVVTSLATIARDRGDLERAEKLQCDALDIFMELGDGWGIARSLFSRGLIARCRGDHASAFAFLEEASARFDDLGDDDSRASCFLVMGEVALDFSDHVEATRNFEQTLKLSREVGDEELVAHALRGLGIVAYEDQEYERAAGLLEQALHLLLKLRAQAYAVECLEAIADLAVATGAVRKAARLTAAADTLRQSIDMPRLTPERDAHERRIAALQEALDDRTFTREWKRGTAMNLQDAAALARQIASDLLAALSI